MTDYKIVSDIDCPHCAGAGKVASFTEAGIHKENCWRCVGTGKRILCRICGAVLEPMEKVRALQCPRCERLTVVDFAPMAIEVKPETKL